MLHISHKPTLQPKITKKYVLPTHRQTTERQCVTTPIRNAGKLQNFKIITTFEYRQI